MSPASPRQSLTYASAGVDLDAGEASMGALGEAVASTWRPEVMADVGPFAGLFSLAGYQDPVLVSSTDGVGTKALVARDCGKLSTIGIDLVAMCVDDVVCQGGEPLFLLDYIAAGHVRPDRVAELVAGVAEGCRLAGCALLGGETAEHPGAMGPDDFDIAGFAVGVAERDCLIGAELVRPGDSLVGIHSPGLRCNGYSLVRKVFLDHVGMSLDDPAWAGASQSLGEELLKPSVIYAPGVLALMDQLEVHAAAHVTGGGIASNLARALPHSCNALVDRGSWSVPRVFSELQRAGSIDGQEMDRVFNLGLGMVLFVPATVSARACRVLGELGYASSVVGEVVAGDGEVRML